MGISILYALWIIVGINEVTCQSDSLRSALNAVDRRQRYLFEKYPAFYARENTADLSYVPNPVSVGGNEVADYFPDGEDDFGNQISSSFREKIEEDREKELRELSQRVLSNLEFENAMENADYRPVRERRYKFQSNPYPRTDRLPYRNIKRQFYPDFGYDSIGLKKRDKYAPADYSESNYQVNVNDDYPNDYIDMAEDNRRSPAYWEERYEHVRPNSYSNFRHIPVAKRSSDYTNISDDQKQQQQYPTKTDPKVEKDLSSVFTDASRNSEKNSKHVPETKKGKINALNTTKTDVKRNNTEKSIEENVSSPVVEKSIQISKKSIDWSDYFGLDRRKKNSENSNKRWFRDRYHKAVAASKKTTEYPLLSFHDHDETVKNKNTDNQFDDMKLNNMDRKLKNIEDEIVDDALKFTGANEGVTDPKDVQDVKDGIISRLAKAYSIEKMRRALAEYKMLLDKEREKSDADTSEDAGNTISEEKRVSIPRKQAIDPNADDQVEDNHIKCTQGSADCDEENYKTPVELIEQMNYEVGGCPKIQRDCGQVASLLGQYGNIFEEACVMHQMCLLCGSNNWYPANRQCNVLYLSKAFDMCEGKIGCQKELQKSVRYLININRNLRNNPLGDCNLVCPDGPDAA